MTVVVVDAENVRRSTWPNLSRDDLVARCRAWAVREGRELLLVFDGAAPADASDLVGSGARSADDVIAGLQLDGDWWLVSSDRGLRARVDPSRTIGGGSFLRELRV